MPKLVANAPRKRFEYLVKQYWDKPFGWLVVAATYEVAYYLFGMEAEGGSYPGRRILKGAIERAMGPERIQFAASPQDEEILADKLGIEFTGNEAWKTSAAREVREGYDQARAAREQAKMFGLDFIDKPSRLVDFEYVGRDGEKGLGQKDTVLLALAASVTRMPQQHDADFLLPWVARELNKLLKAVYEFFVWRDRPSPRGPSPFPGPEAPPTMRDFDNAVEALVTKGPAIAMWAKETKTDINRVSLAQALEAIETHEFKTRRVPQGKVVYEFPDGWTVQELPPEALRAEGEVMQHCVGSYCDVVTSGHTVIYSLRDPAGNPHVTMEWHPPGCNEYDCEYDATKGHFEQIYGKQNAPVVDKYKPYVVEFVKKMKGADPDGLAEAPAADSVFENPASIGRTWEHAGMTGTQREVDYLGLRVLMRPSKFLALAPPMGDEGEYQAKFEEYIASEGKIAPAWLKIEVPDEWLGEKKPPRTPWLPRVVGHEGRHRMTAIQKTFGDDPVEVHLTFRAPHHDVRRHDIDLDVWLPRLQAIRSQEIGGEPKKVIYAIEGLVSDDASQPLDR
jgi:hypothetical protein